MFRMPSNRRLNPQNSKVVKVAQDTIKNTAAISQERYWNAFQVNGYTCTVYNKLSQGRLCTCSMSEKHNVMKPILDEEGNAPQSVIQTLLNGGLDHGIYDYSPLSRPENPTPSITKLKTKRDITERTLEDTALDLDEFIEEEYDEDFLNNDLSSTSTNRCGICYGSGYVGGFNICFGNRFVFDSTWPEIKYHGYSVHQEKVPYLFKSISHNAYIEFRVTLPASVASINSFRLLCNFDTIHGTITASVDGTDYFELTEQNLREYCLGRPVIIRVSNAEIFSHLEIELNLSEEPTLLEYPKITKTGDVSVIDDIGDVTIYVSPKIAEIKPKDIIVDNTLGKIWRVVGNNDHKDKNYNIHGWEITARVVQPMELFSNLPVNKSSQRQKTVNLNRA